MKKLLLMIFSFIILSAISFGAGIGIAELAIRNNAKQQEAFSVVSKIQEETTESQPEKIEEAVSVPTEEAVPAEEKTEEAKPAETTAPAPVAEPIAFSFAVLGDAQYAKPGVYGGLQKSIKKITALNADFIIAMGDRVSSCDSKNECKEKLLTWKSFLGKYSSKVYSVQGNHDRTGREKADSAWQEVFNLPTNGPAGYSELVYSFNFKNSHFVILDSEKPEEHIINGTQRAWLEQDLNKNKLANTFIFFHEPAYPVSSKIKESLDVKPGERDALWNIITRHKATAVFVGHEHIHSRRQINGVYQFGFGNTESFDHEMPVPGVAEYAYRGQNFGLVEVKDKEITVKVYSVDGSLLNTKTFTK